jgi:hypothetical protein
LGEGSESPGPGKIGGPRVSSFRGFAGMLKGKQRGSHSGELWVASEVARNQGE